MAEGDCLNEVLKEARKNGHTELEACMQTWFNESLVCAARVGSEKCVRLLIEAGTDVKWSNSKGDTALHSAARVGSEKCVRLLIEAGADVNQNDSEGETPFVVATQKPALDCMETLIKAGADVNALDRNGQTMVCCAAQQGWDDIVRFLVDHGSSVNDPGQDEPLLFRTLQCKKATTVRTLLELGADINQPNRDGSTPLTYSLECKQTEDVHELIKMGVSVNSKDAFGNTPLCLAVENSPQKVVSELLQRGANVNADATTEIPLSFALKRRNSIAKNMVKLGADINGHENETDSPLVVAIRKQRRNMALDLIALGADVNGSGYSPPLVEALKMEEEEIILSLLENGADVNTHGKDRITPLGQAIKNKNKAIVQKIINAGADVSAHLWAAVDVSYPLEQLFAAGADVAAQLNPQPLFWRAVDVGHLANAKLLLKHRATVGGIPALMWDYPYEDDFLRLAFVAGADMARPASLDNDDPLNLQDLCRKFIRGHMMRLSKVNLFYRVARLGLPKAMEKFLLYEESIDM